MTVVAHRVLTIWENGTTFLLQPKEKQSASPQQLAKQAVTTVNATLAARSEAYPNVRVGQPRTAPSAFANFSFRLPELDAAARATVVRTVETELRRTGLVPERVSFICGELNLSLRDPSADQSVFES